jgi:cobyrinic acid a,c-diamide synthase
MRALVIAGTHSGVGKTTVSIALMAAYRRRGLVVQGFKAGPDFIDPGFHEVATGRPGRNLDTWMLDQGTVRDVFKQGSAGADLAIVEGVMGLFDGASGSSGRGSTAELAGWLDLPVLLVLDAAALARSAAAIVSGFETFDPQINLTAVIANNIAGPEHYRYLEEAIRGSCRAEPLGWLGRDPTLQLPERHLGLVSAAEVLNEFHLNALADWVEAGLDLDLLLCKAGSAAAVNSTHAAACTAESDSEEVEQANLSKRAATLGSWWSARLHPLQDDSAGVTSHSSVKIGIARDRAFCFYYRENLELLQSLGAELIYWSPVTDPLPPGLSGLYFGGGYPELYASELSSNRAAIDSVRAFASTGGFIYAECGGLMYLTESIVDTDQIEHAMVGVVPVRCYMRKRLVALGYVQVEGTGAHVLLQGGEKARGQQFRYSDIDPVPEAVPRAYVVRSSRRPETPFAEGYCINNSLASYVHLHFLSNPEAAAGWLNACRNSLVET